MQDYQLKESLYTNCSSGVAVYRAINVHSDAKVAIKFKKTLDSRKLNEMEIEARVQRSFDHPNFCKLFDTFVYQENEFLVLAMVMELLSSDLNREVNVRRGKKLYWSEEELVMYLFQIVDALDYLQQRDLCHRDIKPHNIFLDSNDVIKLGDFGATCSTLNNSSFSIQGTPLYLSPLLRKHYSESLADPSVQTLHHNPYKSDVFSLGVTMVHLARLECPKSLAVTTHFQGALERAMTGLVKYSEDFRGVVRVMLTEDEEMRPDFKELKRILTAQFEHQSHVALKGLVRCLQCRKGLEAGMEVATLLCQPGDHAFCSRDCFQTFILHKMKEEGLQQVPCPLCPNSFIPQEYVEEVFGGQSLLQQALKVYYQKDQMCSWCRLVEPLIPITQCRHHYCAGCLKTWRKYWRPVPLKCPKCDIPFNASAVKLLKKDCRLL